MVSFMNTKSVAEQLEEIRKLKKEKNALVIAHNYQIGDIQDVADFVGDSLGLSYAARDTNKDIIVFCGVDFMAETAKVINPTKKVLIPNKYANCPMAAMVDVKSLKAFKEEHPNAAVVSYVNTSAEVKAISDICCTSANAINIVKKIPQKEIIFVPDQNLAKYVMENVKDKKIYPWPGYCYTHNNMKKDVIEKIKSEHPDAPIIVHPECRLEVIGIADKVSSTEGMISYAKKNPAKQFIIATEEGMIHRLKKEVPDKEFIAVPNATCSPQKRDSVEDLLNSLINEIYEVKIEPSIIESARIPIERMLAIGRTE